MASLTVARCLPSSFEAYHAAHATVGRSASCFASNSAFGKLSKRARSEGSETLLATASATEAAPLMSVLGVSTAVRDESRGATCLNAASARLRSEVVLGAG